MNLTHSSSHSETARSPRRILARIFSQQRFTVSLVIAASTIFAFAPSITPQNGKAVGQDPILQHESKPWTGGTADSAMRASKAGSTIPLSTYSISVTKDNERKPRTGTIVGTSPFASNLSGSTINVVIIPMVITIGNSVFDPTAPNPVGCGDSSSGATPIDRFMASPLVVPVPDLTFNGVNVGTSQFTDGFMRAEFWNTISAAGKNPANYSNPMSFSVANPIYINPGSSGITTDPAANPCLLGAVSDSFLSTELRHQLQVLTTAKVISTTQVAFFMMTNVTLSTATPPTLPGTPTCCIGGYHTATGTTPQFWGVFNYNTRAVIDGVATGTDTLIASHELAEFMNDPLGNNGTPLWGGVGQVASGACQGNLEVADPLTGTYGTIVLNNYTYRLQEMAFFSWFFNSPSTPSLGAGGKYSSNGTFAGPSKICPPGGTN